MLAICMHARMYVCIHSLLVIEGTMQQELWDIAQQHIQFILE